MNIVYEILEKLLAHKLNSKSAPNFGRMVL